MTVTEVPELVPARMLNEYAYCPRLFFLEWVDRLWDSNADVEEGNLRHRRVDAGGERRRCRRPACYGRRARLSCPATGSGSSRSWTWCRPTMTASYPLT